MADPDALLLPDVSLNEGERVADVDTANLRTLNEGGLASGQSGVALLGKEIEGVIVVGVIICSGK